MELYFFAIIFFILFPLILLTFQSLLLYSGKRTLFSRILFDIPEKYWVFFTPFILLAHGIFVILQFGDKRQKTLYKFFLALSLSSLIISFLARVLGFFILLKPEEFNLQQVKFFFFFLSILALFRILINVSRFLYQSLYLYFPSRLKKILMGEYLILVGNKFRFFNMAWNSVNHFHHSPNVPNNPLPDQNWSSIHAKVGSVCAVITASSAVVMAYNSFKTVPKHCVNCSNTASSSDSGSTSEHGL